MEAHTPVSIEGLKDLRKDTAKSEHDAQRSFIRNDPPTGECADNNDQASLRVSDNRTLNRAGVSNDEELRDVDHGGEETAKRNHQPHVCWCLVQSWEFVRPWDHVEEDDSAEGSLVEEELEAVDFVFSLVGAYPDGVDAADSHTAQREKDAETANSLNRGASYGSGFLVVV